MFRNLFRRYMAPDPPGGGDGGDPPAGDPPAGDPPAGDPPAGSILGDPPAGDPPAGDPPAGEWFFADGVKGEGTVPPYLKVDKFKSVAEQAAAFPDLEAKLGPAAEMLGAPEGDYEMPKMPDGVDGDWDPEDAMLKTFTAAAKEAGFSQAAFEKILVPMAALLATEEAAAEKQVSDALAEIGTNSAERIGQVQTFMIKELGEDGYKAINDAIGTSVPAYLALEKLVGKAAGDAQLSSLPGKSGLGFNRADIEAEQWKVFPEGHNMAGKKMYDHDKDHRAKVDGMWKELFPGDDVQQVG